MNKYYQILGKVLEKGKTQTNKKGNIRYLLNERLSLTPADLLDIFESHGIARKKLKVTPHVGVWIETSVSIENIVCPVNILLKHFVNSKRNSNFAV